MVFSESLRIEDLSIAEDGSIFGLPDEVYRKHDNIKIFYNNFQGGFDDERN